MTIVADQLLGSRGYAPGAGSTSFNFTTSNAASSGSFIVIGFGYFGTVLTVSSVSGGGLTWSVDKAGGFETGHGPGSTLVGIASAQAPSGLASSTTIAVNLSGGTTDPDVVIGGASFTGVATSSPVDGTPPLIDGPDAAQAAWATTSQTLTAGSLLVGVSYFGLGGTLTNTPTAPAAEIFDIGDTVLGAGVMEYRIEAVGGSYNVAGTWSSNTGQSLWASVAYLAATGGPPPVADTTTRRYQIRRSRMTSW